MLYRSGSRRMSRRNADTGRIRCAANRPRLLHLKGMPLFLTRSTMWVRGLSPDGAVAYPAQSPVGLRFIQFASSNAKPASARAAPDPASADLTSNPESGSLATSAANRTRVK